MTTVYRFESANTAFFDGDVFQYTESDAKMLRSLAMKHPTGSARICLHKSQTEGTQNMIIYLLANRSFPAHFHPKGKSESYTIISGTLYVDLISGSNSAKKSLILTPSNTPYMHRGRKRHKTYTKEEDCIYQEIYHGTFNKDIDVCYL